ncbi:RNA-directed DNA polymerase [Marinomonas agarivorans]|nr:RNA-directed DNA polymerase [Marinomonas agarivorans]
MSLIKKLAKKLEKSEAEVATFLANAPLKYKVYKIPKRTSGHRVIAQPSKELKKYQRAFISLFKLTIHNSAMAYREKRSIKDNANKHKHNPYLLKLDLENFFNSISSELFWKVWQAHYPIPQTEDKVFMEKLLFWSPSKSVYGKLILSIGAPTSPLLSNFFMYQFDHIIHDLCVHREIIYTRYADDLTFSTKHKGALFNMPDLVTEQLRKCFGEAININRRKTAFSSKGHNRHITGITIDNNDNLSLGRERKRYIKHLINEYKFNKLGKEDINHLKGLLAYAKHIEPSLMTRLEHKYSTELMTQLFEENYE